ncbi:MAG: glycosyltransferase [Lachnospiraceae bacterium]|nr:glycosyltransferase [Lachnospiraceae bacterium]
MKIWTVWINKFKYFYNGLDKSQSKIQILRVIVAKVFRTIYWRIRNLITKKFFSNDKVTPNFIELNEKYYQITPKYPDNLFDHTIDIIIPVYNGYEYLEPLVRGIEKTAMPYRVIFINDNSPDIRVTEFLKQYKETHENTILIQNEKNLGFVKSVNKGFCLSSNHIALVNTDVEVPDQWLERLMQPILTGKKIASSTPFTNCGTICSFPDFCKDNELLEGMSLAQIDGEFMNIRPSYTKMPTGVGFCMGINREAIHKIGLFDEIYKKGYCEENDWCQRAIKKGYKNVQVENLFVYHKHGGSFSSEEKIAYQKENQKILQKRYPNYLRLVAQYCEKDPNQKIRDYVLLRLLMEKNEEPVIMSFDHCLGGGATAYLNHQRKDYLNQNYQYVLVEYNIFSNSNIFHYYRGNKHIQFKFNYLKELVDIFSNMQIEKIYINELVTYQELDKTFEAILALKEKHQAKLIMLLHDYYSICPMIYLLDDKGCFCGVPDIERCEVCAGCNKNNMYRNYGSIKKYREEWNSFLTYCDEVRTFSSASSELFQKVYGNIDSITVVPHKVRELVPVQRVTKLTKTLNIGLLGMLSVHKGLRVVKELLHYIEMQGLEVRIILLGESETGLKDKNYIETGKYNREMLPRLVLENDLDIFLIPSIWPETFSYTTEEIMKMDMPLAVYDFGAPAERVKKYAKGCIIEHISAKDTLEAIMNFMDKQENLTREDKSNKILFVAEYISFSSRYRVDHHREQLLLKGIASDFVELEKVGSIDLTTYEKVVIYRCTKEKACKKLIDRAHGSNRKVYYDIDDYIFNYKEIKELHFLENENKSDYEQYARSICEVMNRCDGYFTSTETLAEEIQKSFPNKSITVNRNVASMEMKLLSDKAADEVERDKGKVVLGYFSGTKTHDGDFETIATVILDIMQQYKNAVLFTVGAIELSAKFNSVKERVIHREFVDWKQLPELIASVDINLMPLQDTIFHECKSENKWTEAGLVKVPTIASYNRELAISIHDNQNGFLCRNTEEWREKLSHLIENAQSREQIGKQAYQDICKYALTKRE